MSGASMARWVELLFALSLFLQLSLVMGLTGASRIRPPAFLNTNTTTSGCISLRLKKRVSTIRLAGGRASKKMVYFGEVTVGSPLQSFGVVFDTGSGNLILPGSHCTSSVCQMHSVFNISASSTQQRVMCDGTHLEPGAADPEDEVKVTFGTGYISGQCYQDHICLGSACTEGMFISSTDESFQPFSAFTFDGILGLGLPSLAQSPDFSMIERLKSHGSLRTPVFSVFLSESDDELSEITFGDIKPEHMDSDMFWVDVSGSSGYWQVRIEDIAVNNQKVGLCIDCNVAVDTGTSQLAGPSHVIDQLRDVLGLSADCSNFNRLPKLGFVFGDKVLNLLPHDYVERGPKSCELSLMELDVPPPKGPLFVFGIPFLQRFFTVYDIATSRVGFAVAKHTGTHPPEELLGLAAERGPGHFPARRGRKHRKHGELSN